MDATQVYCPLPHADYVLGATFVHVVHQLREGRWTALENASNATVRLFRGNATGELLDSQATDGRGCATFLLDAPGRYRFQASGPCNDAVAALGWNRTFMDQVEMTVSDCE